MPARPNILVTGTPGTGKTSLCERIVERLPALRHVNVGDLVRERGLHAGRDPAHGTLLIDEASEDRIVDELEGAMSGAGGVVLEHHGVDFFPERWFDLVLVLRTDNTVLFDRLTKRCVRGAARSAGIEARPPPPPPHTHTPPNPRSGYPPEKVAENVECEIMEVVAEEARASYREEVVVCLPSNTLEDMESNLARVCAWVPAWERDHAAAGGGGGSG
jgi:adenylate kinase